MVYFIQARAGGPVKIGRAFFPKKRLKELQLGNPERLVIVGELETEGWKEDIVVEQEMHVLFHVHRMGRTEWFMPCVEMREFAPCIVLDRLDEVA